MGEVFGGTVTLAPHLVHGKADDIKLDRSCPLFKNLPPVIKGARYHSLIVERDSLPPELLVTAETYAGEIMGLRHRDYEIYGLQFHPESIMTPMGASIIENFLRHVGVAVGGDGEFMYVRNRRRRHRQTFNVHAAAREDNRNLVEQTDAVFGENGECV